ncbi:MAG: 2-amino-4-hydroxy-6-hydroxymethyldihydropteridine diphosphokinase [Armatimonadetes bacterium]|nr:2-amino-4-hydroxy-6-hydroxymethyldihydropteridine diphosphokinase [Armatimonadota bacterium]MDE2207872.1 2-amino-4-hydroxy-6-hydroxymethyldihydropteridine diphosphokinase [Armatimonadota bacterium]
MSSQETSSLRTAFLGLGSSLGDRRDNLCTAVLRLARTEGIIARRHSSLYTSPHLGPVPTDAAAYPHHFNCVIELHTVADPKRLLEICHQVEVAGGRNPGEHNLPRSIDIDLLLMDNIQAAWDDLVIPHPRLHERPFVVVPLDEIAPDLVLPGGFPLAGLARAIDKSELKCLCGPEWMAVL